MTGAVFIFNGVLDLKKHIEAPDKVQLKNALGKIFVGGALFLLPYVSTVALETVGDKGEAVDVQKLPEFNK